MAEDTGDANPLKAIKEVHIMNTIYVNLNRTTSKLSVLFSNDAARERAETSLRIGDIKYSVEPDGSLTIENANQLLLSGIIKIKGKGAELLLGPPRSV
jgi:hypothetical protein